MRWKWSIAITMTLDDVPLYVLVGHLRVSYGCVYQMTQPHQTRKYPQSSRYDAKVFQTRLLQLQATVKTFLFDLNLVLLCVLFFNCFHESTFRA